MAATPNPVIRGYRWSQQFLCPDGTLEPFDEVVSEIEWFRKASTCRSGRLSASTQAGSVILEGQMISITLDPEHTVQFRNSDSVALDFKRIRDGAEVYLGVKMTFPIIEPITKGALG
jgi:hypothetical protein